MIRVVLLRSFPWGDPCKKRSEVLQKLFANPYFDRSVYNPVNPGKASNKIDIHKNASKAKAEHCML